MELLPTDLQYLGVPKSWGNVHLPSISAQFSLHVTCQPGAAAGGWKQRTHLRSFPEQNPCQGLARFSEVVNVRAKTLVGFCRCCEMHSWPGAYTFRDRQVLLDARARKQVVRTRINCLLRRKLAIVRCWAAYPARREREPNKCNRNAN